MLPVQDEEEDEDEEPDTVLVPGQQDPLLVELRKLVALLPQQAPQAAAQVTPQQMLGRVCAIVVLLGAMVYAEDKTSGWWLLLSPQWLWNAVSLSRHVLKGELENDLTALTGGFSKKPAAPGGGGTLS